ncbi:TMhelix containing protein [Vibrio phage 1.225.O._10N.261.48.B7]|nr:TMhelix containing protein [Vibrio phage 1.225.O._10N.261.48.B7]
MMSNLHAVLLIMLGTYVCSSKPDAFVTELGEYDWSLGIVLAIALFGTLSLFDLSLVALKHGIVLAKHFYKEINEWLK